jgi:hypothetical protein
MHTVPPGHRAGSGAPSLVAHAVKHCAIPSPTSSQRVAGATQSLSFRHVTPSSADGDDRDVGQAMSPGAPQLGVVGVMRSAIGGSPHAGTDTSTNRKRTRRGRFMAAPSARVAGHLHSP